MTISQYATTYIYNMMKNNTDITDIVGDRIHSLHENTKRNNFEDVFPMITYSDFMEPSIEVTKRVFYFQITAWSKIDNRFPIMGLKDIIINMFNGHKPETGGVIEYIAYDTTVPMSDDIAAGYAIRIHVITRDTGQMSLLLS